MKKKLTIISTNYPSLNKPVRGVFVYKVAKGLSKYYDVSVVCPIPIHKYFYAYVLGDPYVKNKHNSISIKYMPYFSFGAKYKIFYILSSFSAVINILFYKRKATDIFYGKFIFGAIIAVVMSKIYKSTSVGDFGESDFSLALSKYPDFLVRWSIRNLDLCICVNKTIKNRLLALGVSERNIALIRNGVDINHFNPNFSKNLDYEKGVVRVTTNKIICIFVGHFIKRKGIIEASQAIKKSDCSGIFIGSGKEYPKGSHVLFASEVSNRLLPFYMSQSDIFIFPSYAEGSPNALIEAIASGLPIVGWDIPIMREHTSNDFALLVKENDIIALSDAILKLSKDSKLRCNMSHAARTYAVENYSINKRMQKISSQINNVLQ